MILLETPDFLVLDKPDNISTHTPDGGATPGFVEWAQEILQRELFVVHRLDKGTSGCLVVGKTSPSAARLEKLFTQKQVQKTYIFKTDHPSSKTEFTTRGLIEKRGSEFCFLPNAPETNSETFFQKIAENEFLARPLTGKPHQIRLHAQAERIPVSGDTEHGGNSAQRLFLHAWKLEIDGHLVESPLPLSFGSSISNSPTTWFEALLVQWDRLRFWRNFKKDTTAFRIFESSKLVVELWGSVLQFLNYSSDPLPIEVLDKVSQTLMVPHWFVRQMENRGGDPKSNSNVAQSSPHCPMTWTIQENGLQFEVRRDQGQSSGLFLDQGRHRRQIASLAPGKSVLNLFSYTCGFSVAAAKAGAKEVVSVDASGTSLDWGKKNFELNQLDPGQFEFFKADVLFFLKSCQKRHRKFDLIICDPPTFGRTSEGVWKLQTQLKDLLENILEILNPKGQLLFTCNHEGMNQNWIQKTFEEATKSKNRKTGSLKPVLLDPDFQWPGKQAPLLGFWSALL